MHSVVITGTGLFTPPHVITNEELVASFNTYVSKNPGLQESSVEFIEKASGIKRRYVMDKAGVLDPERMRPRIAERPNEELSIQAEICVEAAREAIEQAGNPKIEAVIAACSNFQRAYPSIAVEVQNALNIKGFAYDLNVACSSAAFGIQNAVQTIQCGAAEAVLVVNPEITSGHLNFRDRDSHFIFGDACTAVVLERGPKPGWRVLSTHLETQFSSNIRNNFGFLNNAAEEHRDNPDKLFVQKGRQVFKEVVPLVARHIQEHLAKLNIKDVKRFWLHQANLNMNELIAKMVLGRPAGREESPVILDEFANTSSAGSIIAFHRYREDLRPGDVGVICAFGAGYSVGSAIVERIGA